MSSAPRRSPWRSLRLSTVVLTLAAAAGSLAIPSSALPTTRGHGDTGLHDGMMPSSSPDAQSVGGLAPAATTTTLAGVGDLPTGVDVARYQHPGGASINWGQVAASGQRFAIVKATELYTDDNGQKTLYTNAYLQSDLNGAHNAGLVVGAYAFAHPENDPIAQADDFASAIGSLPSWGLPPVLDLEVNGGLGPKALSAWTHTFMSTVSSLTGRTPILYTYPAFWASQMANDRTFTSYPLWIARYSSQKPAPVGGWTSYKFWQYTDSGTIKGIPTKVDVSVFNGTSDQLRAMALLPPLSAPTSSTPVPGKPVTPVSTPVPVGRWTGTAARPGGVRLVGWVVDPAHVKAKARARVWLDGRAAQVVTAGTKRADVAAAHPTWGSAHGIDVTLRGLRPGAHTICITGLAATSSSYASLGCKTWNQKGDPKTVVSVTRKGANVYARGWVVDPQTAAPVTVQMKVAGHLVRTVRASAALPVPTGTWAPWGRGHGFATSAPARAKVTVCLTFVNSSYGNSRNVCVVR